MDYRSLQRITHAPGFFWTPPDQIGADCLVLLEDEARHAVTVCRLGVGEMITVCDGQGNAYDCEIVSATSREVTATIVRAHRQLGESVCRLTLAVGVGKPSNFDWIVEKAVELGVARIIPIRTAQSPSGIGDPDAALRRVERWRRLALGAMKQSLRSVWPDVDDIADIPTALTKCGDAKKMFLADPDAPASAASSQISHAMLFVGPESGFTENERRVLLDAGVIPFNLGRRRLRAETAAIAAVTLFMHQMGEI